VRPTVSAIIPVYNYGRYVAQAIESVLGQTCAASEIIVVDDGSTDNTPEVLKRYEGRIRIIHKENGGVSSALNRGAEAATGDLLAFLDADDVWLPRKLQRQVERFLADPDLGLVHCAYEEIDCSGKVLRYCREGLEGWVAPRLLLFQGPAILGGGSGYVVPRSLFWSVGGFDPRIAVSQDWDLGYRVAARKRVGFVPEVLLQYRLHGTNGHRNVRRMEHDMLLAFGKAFAEPAPDISPLRRRAYGRLHTVFAGSYYRAGQYPAFLRHAARGLFLDPRNLGRFLGYPLRLWQRRCAPGANATLHP
jgi:glycosyltransferase involved in cell wall biosynthesis